MLASYWIFKVNLQLGVNFCRYEKFQIHTHINFNSHPKVFCNFLNWRLVKGYRLIMTAKHILG